ncbi:MAG TPA: transglycosylase SLT domain-containing protein [Dehalococcoidia bacterium]|nr:transglycosylase SLT domain-containing protein [Dehalococcoidia bacterium]
MSARYLYFPLLAVLLLIVACSKDDQQPEVIVTPLGDSRPDDGGEGEPAGPGVALTPQPGLNVDMETARRLESEGDIERAAAAYIAIGAGNSSESKQGTLAAARLLLELERPDDVRLLLEPFVERDDLSGEDLAAHYLLARCYAALDMWAESLAQYDLYAETDRAALPYALLDRAQPLLALGRTPEAIASVQEGLNLGVPASQRSRFLLAIAQAHETSGALGEAIAAYRGLIDNGSEVTRSLSRIIDLKRQLGDGSYTTELTQLLGSYPGSAEALDNLKQAEQRGEPVLAVVRGLIHYRHNDYPTAEPAFKEQIALSPNALASAEAYYYLAAIQESRNEIPASLTNYTRATELNPQSPIADDALWWRARIHEIDGQLEQAGALYARIVNEYTNSQFYSDAAFRNGMLKYRAGDFVTASTLWSQGAAAISDPLERSRLQIWQAKALIGGGSVPTARPILERLAADHEDDYPGVRARSLLAGKPELPSAEDESDLDMQPDFDWTGAETWLSQRTGRAISDAGWSADARWARAQELWLVGRVGYGDAEIFGLIEAYAGDGVAMYTMSRRLEGLGRVSMSARAGQRLLRVLNTNPNAGLPKPLLSLSYPAAFGSLVEKYAGDQDVSPLLLLAFIRQESFFDPRATSPVGALGLTQVLPPTGEAIADTLGVNDFETEQLLHADLNLRFGAKYMADQLEKFEGEIFVAFAAYNAGPTAAERWREASGEDADLFLETIEFHESRLYVEIVSENYAIYRYLYGGQPEPNLPD